MSVGFLFARWVDGQGLQAKIDKLKEEMVLVGRYRAASYRRIQMGNVGAIDSYAWARMRADDIVRQIDELAADMATYECAMGVLRE